MSAMAAKLSTLIKSGGKLKQRPRAFENLQCANRRFKVRKTNRGILLISDKLYIISLLSLPTSDNNNELFLFICWIQRNSILCGPDVSLIIWPEFLWFSPTKSLLSKHIRLIKKLFQETKPVLCFGPVLSRHQHSHSAPVAQQIVRSAHPKPGTGAAQHRPRQLRLHLFLDKFKQHTLSKSPVQPNAARLSSVPW